MFKNVIFHIIIKKKIEIKCPNFVKLSENMLWECIFSKFEENLRKTQSLKSIPVKAHFLDLILEIDPWILFLKNSK